MTTNLSFNQADMTRVAQQMVTQSMDPKVGAALGSGIKAAEFALLNFDPQRVSGDSQPLADSAPVLAEPTLRFVPKDPNANKTDASSSDNTFNSQGSLVEVLAQLGEISADLTLSQLQQAADQLASTNQAMADRLDQLGNDYQAAVDAAAQATDTAEAKADALVSAQQALTTAQDAVKQAQAYLDKHPNDPTAQAALAEAQGRETAAQAVFDQAKTESAAAAESAQQALALADDLDSEIHTDLGNLRSLSQQSSAMSQKHLDAGAQLAMVMAMLSNSIADSLENYQEGMAKMTQASQEKRIEVEKTKEEERKKEADKQAAMSKNVNCAMKILGAIITAIATVGAIFTGGASLGLAVAGLAMMAVDQVVKAATGTSLTDRIMQPLMEHVLKPMIEGISKLVTGLLEACGVSKEDAEMAGNIIGAVVGMALMAAVVIGAMVLGKSSQAQKLLKPMLKMAEKMIAKLIPQVLKEAGAEGAAMLSKGISRLTSGLKNTGNKVLNSVDEQLPDGLKNAGKNVYSKMGGRSGIGNTMQRGANGMSMVSAVATGATSGVIADSQKKLDKLKALIDKLMAQDALDSDFTSGMLKHVKALMAMLDSIDSSMSEVINADTSRSNFILNNLSGHAA